MSEINGNLTWPVVDCATEFDGSRYACIEFRMGGTATRFYAYLTDRIGLTPKEAAQKVNKVFYGKEGR